LYVLEFFELSLEIPIFILFSLKNCQTPHPI